MGNHTWFYRKNNLTLEECKKKVIGMLENYIKFNFNDTDNISESEQEESANSVKNASRILSWIKMGKIKESCYRLLDSVGYYDEKTKIYYVSDVDLPYDVFRFNNKSDLKLFSLEETLDFLEKNDSNIRYGKTIFDKTDRETLKKKAIEDLKKFWENNPDGMIDFG